MLIDHDHPPGLFDAGHCWACAHQAGLLDHYDRVQDRNRPSPGQGMGLGGPPVRHLGAGILRHRVFVAAPPFSPNEPATTGPATRRELTGRSGVRLAADMELSASGRRRGDLRFVPSSCVQHP
jgi:hypothetical protein